MGEILDTAEIVPDGLIVDAQRTLWQKLSKLTQDLVQLTLSMAVLVASRTSFLSKKAQTPAFNANRMVLGSPYWDRQIIAVSGAISRIRVIKRPRGISGARCSVSRLMACGRFPPSNSRR
jgi:hypothetical protein